MKKIAFFLLFISFALIGCEKKEAALPPVSGNLTVWVSGNVDFWEALGREFVSIFNSPYLEVRVIRFESETELKETLINSLAEAKGPDVILTTGDWIIHNTGKLIPLQNDEALQPEKFSQYFVPSVMDLLVSENTIWGVPLGVDTLAVIYNAGHFAETFGEDYQLGETWKTFRDQGKALTKTNNSFERFARSGIALGRVDNTMRGEETFLNLFVQLVGDLFSEDETEAVFAGNNGVTSTGERVDFALQALKFYLGFANPSTSYYSWNEFLVDSESEFKDFEAFVKGDVSAVFGTAKDLKTIQSLFVRLKGSSLIPENNVRVGFLPQFESPTKTASREVIASVPALAVPASSRDSQLAWQFLKFSIRSANLQGFYRATGIPAPLQDLLTQQEVDKDMEIFSRQAKIAKARVFPFTREKIQEGIRTLITRVQTNKATPSQGLEQLESSFTGELQRQRTLLKTLFSPVSQ